MSSATHACKEQVETLRTVPPQSMNVLSMRPTSVMWACAATRSPSGNTKRNWRLGDCCNASLKVESFIFALIYLIKHIPVKTHGRFTIDPDLPLSLPTKPGCASSNLLAKGPLCVCHFQAVLQVPQVAISKHLAYLRKHELVASHRHEQWMIYALPEKAF